LRRGKDTNIAAVRRGLDDFLSFAPKILSPFLFPTRYPEAECRRLYRSLEKAKKEALQLIFEFVSKHGTESKEHRQVYQFIHQIYKDIIRRIETFYSLLQDPHPEIFVAMANDLEYIEDIKQLQSLISITLTRLRQEPNSEKNDKSTQKMSFKDLLAQSEIITSDPGGLIDDMSALSLDRQFHDWAWSPTGASIPDYHKDVTDVYTEFTVKYIQDDHNLSILSSIEDRSVRKQMTLPSWVPDFSVTPERSQIHFTRGVEQPLFSASGTGEADAKWSVDEPGLLKVGGYDFSRIKALSSLESATADAITTQPEEWAAMIKRLPASYPTGISTSDALWRTLIGDKVQISGKTISPAPIDCVIFYSMALRVLDIRRKPVNNQGDLIRLLQESGVTLEQFLTWTQKYDLFLEAMAPVMLQRRLCVTESGYIGAVPSSAEVGDSILVLKGGPVPYVLRKLGSEQDRRFELVGECYVHGIMRGENGVPIDFKEISVV
jgi:hypothetical protein